MKRAFFVILLLASSVLAQDKLGTTTEDTYIRIIEAPVKESLVRLLPKVNVYAAEEPLEDVKAVYDVDGMFKEIVSSSGSCFEDCRLRYKFTNNLPYPLPTSAFYLKQYGLDGSTMANNLVDYQVDFIGLVGSSVAPGESVEVSIRAVKVDNVDMDVVPSVVLTKAVDPNLKAYRVDLERTDWVIWYKGPVTGAGVSEGWAFDESSGNAVGYSGTQLVPRNSPLQNQTGVFSKSVKFDGFNDFFNVSDSSLLSPTSDLTISLWIKPDNVISASGDQWIFNKYDSGASQTSFLLYIHQIGSDYPIGFCIADASSTLNCVNSSYAPPINLWTNVIGVFDASAHTLKVYFNGTDVTKDCYIGACNPSSIKDSTAPLVVGVRLTNYGLASGTGFNGTLEQSYFITSAYTQEQALNTYLAGLTETIFISPSNLSSYSSAGDEPYPLGIDALVGFPDQTLASNITYVNGSGSVLILRTNAGVELNQSGTYLTKVNTTHYRVEDTGLFDVGTHNLTLTACGGNSLISCSTSTVFFSVAHYMLTTNNCQTPFDYCARFNSVSTGNYSLQYLTLLDQLGMDVGKQILGLPATNIENQPYFTGNLSRIFIQLDNGSRPTTYNVTENLIVLEQELAPACPGGGCSTIPTNLTLCLEGSSSYNHPLFKGSAAALPLQKTITGSDFSQYYRRNWTFNYEPDNTTFGFDGHSATLRVSCEHFGAFEYNLTVLYPVGPGWLTVQTLEEPKFTLLMSTHLNESDPGAYSSVEHVRQDPDHFLKGNYYVNNHSLMFPFSLVDYTSQCNNLVKFSRLVGNNDEIIWFSRFDMDRMVFPYLQNNTEYRLRVYCNDGSIRDLGYLTTKTQLNRNIEVTNINLGSGSTVYAGGLRLGNLTADYASETIYLPYSKDEGTLTNITFKVYDLSAAPMSLLYSSTASDVSGGSFSYDTDNRSKNYYVEVEAFNLGSVVHKAETVMFRNESSAAYVDRSCVICILPSEFLGVSDVVAYKALGLLGMVLIGLGFAPVDAGFAVVGVLGWELLMDLIGWHDIPNWLSVSAGLLALALTWGMMRRHDE